MSKVRQHYDRIARFYDLLQLPAEMVFARWRRRLLSEVKGETLEVGIGTGKNIPYYPDGTVLTGIDISEKMINIARKRADKSPEIRLLVMDAENMLFNDNTFDTVVSTCVFCSVPDPVQGLREIKRVCRKDGKLLMLEHVLSRKKIIGRLMNALNFIPCSLCGVNINRSTYDNLLKAGFEPENIEVKNVWLDIVKIFRITNSKKS